MGKKKSDMKSMIIMVAVVMLIFFAPNLIVALMQSAKPVDFGTSGLYQEDEVREVSAAVIELVSSGSFQKVLDDYAAEDVRTDENVESLETAAKTIADDWGAYRETGSVTLRELKQQKKYYASLVAEVVYENVTLQLEIVYNEEMKLIGLSMQEAATETN